MKKNQNLKYLATAVALACAMTTANARDIYRVVQPNGDISYTDSPGPNDNATLVNPHTGEAKQAAATSVDIYALPANIRDVYRSYPVTLYTSGTCSGACQEAQKLLRERGIPYLEYTISTAADLAEFKKQTSLAGFPALKVGGKSLEGFAHNEWVRYLDAAGYPKSNQLGSNYIQPAPMPLTTPQDESKPVNNTPPPVVERGHVTPTPSSDRRTPENPSGIRF